MTSAMVSSSHGEVQSVNSIVLRGPFDPDAAERDDVDYTSCSTSSGSHAIKARQIDFDDYSAGKFRTPIRQKSVDDGKNVVGQIPSQRQASVIRKDIVPESSVVPAGNDDQSIESEMPFDMMKETKKVTEESPPVEARSEPQEEEAKPPDANDTSFETIWESSPQRDPTAIDTQQMRQHGDYLLNPPRFTDPTISSASNVAKERQPTSRTKKGKGPCKEVNVQPKRASKKVSVESEQNRKDQPVAELPTNGSNYKSFEDSVFDFTQEVKMLHPDTNGKPVKVTHRFRRRAPFQAKIDDDLDDTSLENENAIKKSPSNLQERSQQAWKFRQKKNSNLRSKRDPTWPRTNNNVSFHGLDTVQYFDPDVDEDSADKQDSDDGRSLNSEYTKSLESEVEDMIKDILLIGNGQRSRPGRRKFRHKHEIKNRLKKQGEQADKKVALDDAVVAETEAAIAETSERRQTPRKKPSSSESVVTTEESLASSRDETSAGESQITTRGQEPSLWDMMEGGMTAVSAALGMTDQNSRGIDDERSSVALPFDACAGGLAAYANNVVSGTSTAGMLDFAQDFVFGEFAVPNGSGSKSIDSSEERRSKKSILESLRKDPDFDQLALHAAISLHEIQGMQFDQSYDIDTTNDLTASSIELKLPLGLIFLENDGGCFVTKISPDGSAARSGFVEVGDQLACINGISSAKMKVDDICNLISQSKNPTRVKLVFLRYSGEFKPIRHKVESSPQRSPQRSPKRSPQRSPKRSPQRSLPPSTPSDDEPIPRHEIEIEALERPTRPVKQRQVDRVPQVAEQRRQPEPAKKKGFRLFGRGKKKGQKA